MKNIYERNPKIRTVLGKLELDLVATFFVHNLSDDQIRSIHSPKALIAIDFLKGIGVIERSSDYIKKELINVVLGKRRIKHEKSTKYKIKKKEYRDSEHILLEGILKKIGVNPYSYNFEKIADIKAVVAYNFLKDKRIYLSAKPPSCYSEFIDALKEPSFQFLKSLMDPRNEELKLYTIKKYPIEMFEEVKKSNNLKLIEEEIKALRGKDLEKATEMLIHYGILCLENGKIDKGREAIREAQKKGYHLSPRDSKKIISKYKSLFQKTGRKKEKLKILKDLVDLKISLKDIEGIYYFNYEELYPIVEKSEDKSIFYKILKSKYREREGNDFFKWFLRAIEQGIIFWEFKKRDILKMLNNNNIKYWEDAIDKINDERFKKKMLLISGEFYEKESMWEEAMKRYTKAILLDPRWEEPWKRKLSITINPNTPYFDPNFKKAKDLKKLAQPYFNLESILEK